MPVTALPQVQEWAVAHTRSRAEKAVAKFFERRGVESYLPLVAHRRVYVSAVRQSFLPLFTGYIFFNRSAIPHHRVFDSRLVARVLIPPDPDALRADLQRIARAIESGVEIRQVDAPRPGRRVRVTAGPLKGLEGEILRAAGLTTLVVRIEFLAKAAELAIDEAYVDPV
jgi:transcriptional antiterminator RfaH